jgi:uncharacterized protein involved in exopolysaccharide biosynthesis
MRRHYQSFETAEGTLERTPGSQAAANPTATEASLQEMRAKLAALQSRYTEDHPDVIVTKQAIASLEEVAKEEQQNLPKAPPSKPVPAARPFGEQLARAETESRLKALNTEIENLKQNAAALERRLRDETQRLGAMPVREQELGELLRRSENARGQYQSLLAKKHDSELTNSLETRQQGERFSLLNYASLPHSPEGRARIVALGWMLGLFLGAGLVLLREKSDASIHSQHDIADCTALPVVARIPTIRSVREARQLACSRSLEIVLVTLLCLISAATGAHTLLAG